MTRLHSALACILLLPSAACLAQAPTVTSLTPAHLAADVDADSVTELVVVFDRPMRTTAFSFCGGGPRFPKLPGGQKPFWRDDRTCVLPVVLEADHSYGLSLNCPAATNFRSEATGTALLPVPWNFTTRPRTPLDPEQQRALNELTLSEARNVLDARYSYRDLRGLDWDALFDEARPDLLAAASARAFTARLAKALAPMEDLHASLRYGGDVFPLGSGRSVDSLFRAARLEKLVGDVKQAGTEVLVARTVDNIGYLALGTFTDRLGVESAEKQIEMLRDCRALILDVRPNAGGDERIAQRIASRFLTGEHVYAKHRLKLSRGEGDDPLAGFSQVFERRIRGYEVETDCFPGRVYLLQSRYVMSSAEAFVLMMRQAERCTTIGQATYGSSGNPRAHDLPNGAQLVLPSWQALRPDGTCFEGEGIAPDVEVGCTAEDLQTGDPILQAALQIVRIR